MKYWQKQKLTHKQILVRTNTKDNLDKIRAIGQSYDGLIRELIENRRES